ncbi:MAG: hypothetical protein MJ105_00590 [Lachnospiraceae bacterium]|nr:hypothetical protein [Lachnospiraceae bacterium]
MKTYLRKYSVILRKGILFALSFGMIFFLLCGVKANAKKNSDYDAKDFDFSVTVDECDEESMTLTVDIENNGQDFEGYFRIIFNTASYRYNVTAYDTELTLPAGSMKTFTLSVPTTSVWPDDISYVRFLLVDYADNTIELDEDSDLLYGLSSGRNLGGSVFLSEMEYPFDTFNGQAHPLHAARVIVLVLLFVVLAGPIGYLVLAKNKKREMYWVFVPVISLLFILFIFLIGGNTRLTGVSLLSVRMVDGNGYHDDHVAFMAYNAQASGWDIEFAEDVTAVGGRSENYYYYYYDDREANLRFVNNGRNIHMVGNPTETFEAYYGTATAKNTGKGGCFIANDVEVDRHGEVNGTVSNSTGKDIKYLFVAYEDGVYILEGISNGATVNLDTLRVIDTQKYGRDSGWWLDEVEGGPAFNIADTFVTQNDDSIVAVYGIVDSGEKISAGKARETVYTVYYAVD